MDRQVDSRIALAFERDQFQLDLASVIAECRADLWLPGYRGLVFAPRLWLNDDRYQIVDLEQEARIEREYVAEVCNPLWEQQGFCVARYPWKLEAHVSRSETLLQRYRSALVRAELHTLSLAVDWCHTFLSSRTLGAQRLSQNPVVVQAFGRVVRDLYALQAPEACGDAHRYTEEVDDVAEQLIKLAGGRAMLGGHMVQLRTTLLTMNRLYLEVRPCSS
jgi:hypothetical protein